VNVDDLCDRNGASNADSACTGTSIRDFQRVADFAPMPGAIIAMYENSNITEGVAVFMPGEGTAAEARIRT
jgi:hypothetical protein